MTNKTHVEGLTMENRQAGLTDAEIQRRYKDLACGCCVLVGTKGVCIDMVDDDLLVVTENTCARVSYLDTYDNVFEIARHYIGGITDIKPFTKLVWIDGKISPADV
jgi:hypothetical protein